MQSVGNLSGNFDICWLVSFDPKFWVQFQFVCVTSRLLSSWWLSLFVTPVLAFFLFFQSFRTEYHYGGVAEQSSLDALWSFQVVTGWRNADNKSFCFTKLIFSKFLEIRMFLQKTLMFHSSLIEGYFILYIIIMYNL